jgi:alkaline phosphatase
MDDPNPPARVLGLAQVYSTLQQERGGDGNAAPYGIPPNKNVPTLEEMTKGALNVLSRDPDGFVVMIEGGAVDWASHDNQSGRAIEEQIDFNRAVEAVVAWIETESSWQETILIVSADHETGYLTGPGSGQTPSGPQWKPLVNRGAGNIPELIWNSGGHTSSLVPFYAKGQGTELFDSHVLGDDPIRGKYIDNTAIAKVVFQLLSGIEP